MSKEKKIAICHYRVGGNDGVSLEIKKRKQILESHGCKVKLIAGNLSKGADYTIKQLEWTNGIIPIVKENSFLYFNRRDLSSKEIQTRMGTISRSIERQLTTIQKKEKFDVVLVHNVFSLGEHTAAAEAFTKWINKFKLPTIATHHDLYWERHRFHTPRCKYLRDYMQKYMPPKSSYIEHVVINSLTKRELKRRHGIDAIVIPDVFDFSREPWEKDKFNKGLLQRFNIKTGDLVVLQATRIMPRKGIELTVDFVKHLQKNIKQLRGKTLYNGKKLNVKANVVLVIAGATEQETHMYGLLIKSKALEEKIHIRFISDSIRGERKISEGIKKYSLWDTYAYADLVTFPSIWEGWGNQFIEAIFAKKPIVLFEYPVFKKDIKPEGFQFISLGDKLLKEVDENHLYKIPRAKIDSAVQQSIKWLLNENLYKKLNKNFVIGRKHHDYRVLEDFLIEKLELKQ